MFVDTVRLFSMKVGQCEEGLAQMFCIKSAGLSMVPGIKPSPTI